MQRTILFLILSHLFIVTLAQTDSSFIKRVPIDSSRNQMNMDAVYNRPFLSVGKVPVALGGYIEANSSYFSTNGVTDGLSFQMRRLTIFMSSTIRKRIKFLSEIEFEEGTKEINIEFAAIDLELHPLFNVRGGIILNPIGAFNQNHDGPKWEFIDRPFSATTIIPSTWSNVGFGIHGKLFKNNLIFAYEGYLTNGFDDRVIANPENRTWLPASKSNPDRFEESNNGVPLITLKVACRHRKIGEIGLSWMGGVYNKFRDGGLIIDNKRGLDVVALDFNGTIAKQLYITGEIVNASIEIPNNYSPQFGNRQWGGFVDFVQPIVKRTILKFENAKLNACLRLEYVDYNVGKFQETGISKGDDIWAIVPGLSFRPSAQTVIRANYRYHWETDVLGNPPSKTAGFQFGFSSYF